MLRRLRICCILKDKLNYVAPNTKSDAYYSLSKENGQIVCHRLSTDFKPTYRVDYPKNWFERPTGNSPIEIDILNYLTGV
jgi:hypothetical protein